MNESLAQLRDAVLERHVKVVYVEGTLIEPFCDFCGHEWPCPEYLLATLLSVENVAAGLERTEPNRGGSLREALAVAWDIIQANPIEDSCRHGNDADTCDEAEGCADRSRREQIRAAIEGASHD